MGSVGRTLCRLPGQAGYRNVGLWLPLFPSPAYFHSPQDQCHHLPVSPGPESLASHNNNLATIMEDENNVGTSIGNKENSGYSEENNAEEYDRANSIAALTARKEEAKTRRRKKKTASSTSLASNTFHELYRLTGEVLGQGAY